MHALRANLACFRELTRKFTGFRIQTRNAFYCPPAQNHLYCSPMPDIATETNEDVQRAAAWVATLRKEIGHVIVGQEHLIDRLLVGLLANGHVLLEGVPGLAKTLSVRTLATTIQARSNRILFIPDFLPAHITGTLIYNRPDDKYHATKGPVSA